jgi:hypothetical protein
MPEFYAKTAVALAALLVGARATLDTLRVAAR